MDCWLQKSLDPLKLTLSKKEEYIYGYFSNVTEYKTATDFRIQVIYDPSFSCCNTYEKLFSRFDFNFCKVGFDGYKLHIYDPESIRKRTHILDPTRHTSRIDGRVLKYCERGFIFRTPYQVGEK